MYESKGSGACLCHVAPGCWQSACDIVRANIKVQQLQHSHTAYYQLPMVYIGEARLLL